MKKDSHGSFLKKGHVRKGKQGNKGFLRRPTYVRTSKVKEKTYGELKIWD